MKSPPQTLICLCIHCASFSVVAPASANWASSTARRVLQSGSDRGAEGADGGAGSRRQHGAEALRRAEACGGAGASRKVFRTTSRELAPPACAQTMATDRAAVERRGTLNARTQCLSQFVTLAHRSEACSDPTAAKSNKPNQSGQLTVRRRACIVRSRRGAAPIICTTEIKMNHRKRPKLVRPRSFQIEHFSQSNVCVNPSDCHPRASGVLHVKPLSCQRRHCPPWLSLPPFVPATASL